MRNASQSSQFPVHFDPKGTKSEPRGGATIPQRDEKWLKIHFSIAPEGLSIFTIESFISTIFHNEDVKSDVLYLQHCRYHRNTAIPTWTYSGSIHRETSGRNRDTPGILSDPAKSKRASSVFPWIKRQRLSSDASHPVTKLVTAGLVPSLCQPHV